MKRTTLTASLAGSAAAGLLAVAMAIPAFAQATTYPEGTDCSAISNSASRAECLSQQNESRQLPDNGNVAPSPNGTGNIQPGAPNTPAAPSAAPAGNSSTNTPGGGAANPAPDGGNTDGTGNTN
jgi:hypothetical protein